MCTQALNLMFLGMFISLSSDIFQLLHNTNCENNANSFLYIKSLFVYHLCRMQEWQKYSLLLLSGSRSVKCFALAVYFKKTIFLNPCPAEPGYTPPLQIV